MPRRVRPGAATALLAALAFLSTNCSGDNSSGGPTATAASTSFARIQEQVFAPSCAFSACHAPGNSSGSNLVLTGSGVYDALVNIAPAQAVARSDGLKRVVPGKPDSSLLWHKVNGFLAGHHAHDYGAPMPYAGQSLPAGQIEFIRQWIAGGASASTDIVNPDLLTSTASVVPYVPIAPPASGFQVRMMPFTIGKSTEREVFLYTPVGNAQETWVNRIQTHMRTGSHHFVLYSFAANTPGFVLPQAGIVRDLKDANGAYQPLTLASMAFHVFFAGTQASDGDYTFPPGVAIRIPANAQLDLNSHYVNSTTLAASGEAEANLHTVPAAQVQFEAEPLNLVNTDLTLPAGRDTTIRKTFRFTKLTRVVMLTSHMHKRGLRFVVRVSGGPRNGEVVYQSEAWDHPPILALTTPLVLQPGEGLTSEVTYRGDPSKVVRFGLTADDEMDIIFGYWY
jgi:hypothetical protein